MLGWRSDSAGDNGLNGWLRGALESLVVVHVVHVCHFDRWTQAWKRSRCALMTGMVIDVVRRTVGGVT